MHVGVNRLIKSLCYIAFPVLQMKPQQSCLSDTQKKKK
jgi:hypothetical protein